MIDAGCAACSRVGYREHARNYLRYLCICLLIVHLWKSLLTICMRTDLWWRDAWSSLLRYAWPTYYMILNIYVADQDWPRNKITYIFSIRSKKPISWYAIWVRFYTKPVHNPWIISSSSRQWMLENDMNDRRGNRVKTFEYIAIYIHELTLKIYGPNVCKCEYTLTLYTHINIVFHLNITQILKCR